MAGDPERKRWAARLAALALPFAALAALELVLRAAGFVYLALPPIVIWNAHEDAELFGRDALHEPDPRTLWAPRPGARVPWGVDERVSAHGFRGADPDPGAHPRILVLGDSSTFGYGVRGEETYAARLQRSLKENGAAAVQVLNGGLIGATIVQGLERYRAIRSGWRPDVVVLAFGAVNEHWGSSGLDDIDKLARVRELALNPSRSLSRRLRRDLRVLHLAAWVGDLARGGRAALLADRARRSAWEHRVGEYLKPGYLRRVSPEQFRSTLERFRVETAADGARMILVYMPRTRRTELERPAVLDYDPVLLSFAAENGLTLVDAHADFRASGLAEDALFVDAYHPSPIGHARLAALLLGVLGGS